MELDHSILRCAFIYIPLLVQRARCVLPEQPREPILLAVPGYDDAFEHLANPSFETASCPIDHGGIKYFMLGKNSDAARKQTGSSNAIFIGLSTRST